MMLMMSMLVLFFTGIICILASSIKAKAVKSPSVIYKYIPRDLDTILREDANQPALVYKQLFEDTLDKSAPQSSFVGGVPGATSVPMV